MSFGSSNRRSSGGKGFSGKRDKRKRQTFHVHREKLQDGVKPDMAQLRERTVIAIEKLGHQRLSTEVGGYSLENWVRNFTLLLDDFEEKLGQPDLPPEYEEKKREVASLLANPATSAVVDKEIEEVRRDIDGANNEIAEEKARLRSSIEGLNDEQSRLRSELAAARAKLSELKDGSQTRPLIKRLLGRERAQPAAPTENRIREIDARLGSIAAESGRLQELARLLAERSVKPDAPMRSVWLRLESLRPRLARLEESKMQMTQLAQRREQLAASIAEMISNAPGSAGAN